MGEEGAFSTSAGLGGGEEAEAADMTVGGDNGRGDKWGREKEGKEAFYSVWLETSLVI